MTTTTESNFFLQTSKSERFEDFETGGIAHPELVRIFDAFEANMVEVTYVVQSYFNLMVHAKIQEASNKIYDRNKMLAYADSLRGGYSDDSKRISKDAAERTKIEIENGGFENFSILDTVIKTLNELERDKVIELSNKSTLRQSIVIIWSAIESLIRDTIKFKLNSEKELAILFFESSETAPYWHKKQITFEHIKSYGLDLSNRLGDVALEINSCSNLSSMKVAMSFVFGKNSSSFQNLKSNDFFKLYKLRNVIAHRNGMVDEKYKSEVECLEDVGQAVNVTPELFKFCFNTAKKLATVMLRDISNNSIQPTANASAD